jgi:hypothetical protein
MSQKKTVTKSEYLQLVGLLTLAKKHNEWLEDLRVAALAITQEADEHGHTGDAVYGDYSADMLLDRLNITVEDTR